MYNIVKTGAAVSRAAFHSRRAIRSRLKRASRYEPRPRSRHRHRRPRYRHGLLTGIRGRLTILAVVAEEVDVVTDVSRPKVCDFEVRLSDGLRLAGDVLDARQGAEGTPIRYFVPVQMIDLLLRVVTAGKQPANVIVAAHTFRHDLVEEVAGTCEEIADYLGAKAANAIPPLGRRKSPKIMRNIRFTHALGYLYFHLRVTELSCLF